MSQAQIRVYPDAMVQEAIREIREYVNAAHWQIRAPIAIKINIVCLSMCRNLHCEKANTPLGVNNKFIKMCSLTSDLFQNVAWVDGTSCRSCLNFRAGCKWGSLSSSMFKENTRKRDGFHMLSIRHERCGMQGTLWILSRQHQITNLLTFWAHS